MSTLSLEPAHLSLPEPRSLVGIGVGNNAGLRALPDFQGPPQGLDLLLQPFHAIRLTLAVDRRPVLDVPGPRGVVQRIQTLVKVRGGRADAGYH